MSGAYGFRIDGQDKITYNHSGNDPNALGMTLFQWATSHSVATLKSIARSLVLVSETVPPTAAQIAQCQHLADPSVSTGQLTEWYVLLRDAQGDPNVWGEGIRYLIDNASLLQHSLFCEWGYVINGDDELFEVYQGFNQDPEAQAPRYAIARPDAEGYYACRLVAANDLRQFPNATQWLNHIRALASKA